MSLLKQVPEDMIQVLTVFQRAGFPAYLVGGCVRDLLLGRTPNDWDICTKAHPEQTMALFPRAIPTGLRHGTVTVLYGESQTEVTTFRREGTYTDHRRPDSVCFSDDLTEDLARRDFTVNAMALGLDSIVQDPFQGQCDLKNQTLRCVGCPDRRFEEDALRMFRCLRFAAQLGFSIEPETDAALGRHSELARYVAPERIHVELEKTLCSPRPEWFGKMVQLGLLDGFLPTRETADFHCLSALPPEPTLRWAAGCMALYRAGGLPDAGTLLTALRLDRQTILSVSRGVALAREGFPETDLEIKRLLAQNDALSVRCAAACIGANALERAEQVLRSGDCFELKHLAVGGDDLKARGLEGRRIGAVLHQMLDYVLAHPEENQRERLLKLWEKGELP